MPLTKCLMTHLFFYCLMTPQIGGTRFNGHRNRIESTCPLRLDQTVGAGMARD
nr:hypothetical protein Q903MT_gene714 [Picea sitchensis]